MNEYKFSLQYVRLRLHLLTVQSSLMKILFRYMEEYKKMYFRNLSQILTTLISRKKLFHRLDTK